MSATMRWVLPSVALLTGGCLQIMGWEEARPGWTGSVTTSGSGGVGGMVATTSTVNTTIETGGGGATTTDTGSGGHGGGMVCVPGSTIACYSGPVGTEAKGICKAGSMTCNSEGTGYDQCTGEVLPEVETCGGTEDEDCDGHDCGQWAVLLGKAGISVESGVAVDAAANVFVGGSFSGAFTVGTITLAANGSGGGFLVKLDKSGDVVWGKAFGPSNSATQVTALTVDAQGNAIVGGWTGAATGFGGPVIPPGLFVAKFDGAGAHVWSRGFSTASCTTILGAPVVRSIAAGPDGSVVVGGRFCGSVNFGDGVLSAPAAVDLGFLAKLRGSDGSGKVADGGWSKAFGDGDDTEAAGVAVDSQGNILVTGQFFNAMTLGSGFTLNEASGNIFIAKLSQSGLPQWQRQFAAKEPGRVGVDGNGGVTVTGRFAGSVSFGGPSLASMSGTSGFVAHYKADKTYEWAKAQPTRDALSIDATGNIFVAELFSISKLSPSGAQLWTRPFGGGTAQNQAAGISALAVTPEGDPVLSGLVASMLDFGSGALTPSGSSMQFVARLSR